MRKMGAQDGNRYYVENGIPDVRKSVDHHLVHVVDIPLVAWQRGQVGSSVVIIPNSNSKMADVIDDEREDGKATPYHHAG